MSTDPELSVAVLHATCLPFFCKESLGTVFMTLQLHDPEPARHNLIPTRGLHGDLSSSFLLVTFATSCFRYAQTYPRSLHVDRVTPASTG